MHPDPAFRQDAADALDRAAAIGFAHVMAATPAGPMVVHAPVTRHTAALRFHVSRANRLAPHLADAAVLVSVAGADGYISPNWYERPGDQVPTWNYVAIEIDGIARHCDEAALVEQLDALAAMHEPRVNPSRPWTRAKMDDALFRRMLGGIVGFEVEVTAVRSTAKLSQNKTAADRAGVVAGLRAAGMPALAAAMEIGA
ncbi:FMN-binding negative transcriptional regulator [Sphingomonas rubra]|uniref:Negative transcriptional regulator, PaiB family n=1 Tax=Sphingomonas rubra TaxID=634430 RepID=A0A1I5QLL7_9SPHN|nr:FMN-binding negative transcriptional regulator [Sphingomonas rubra]SFP46980.1 negative transcriptional regulator, PaiB family [Sphingomonas rubra]